MVADPIESFGPISGLAAVLAVAANEGFDGCLVNPVDTPNLTADDLNALIAVHQTLPDQPVCAVTHESHQTRVQPLIAVYPVCSLTAIEKAIQSEQYSLRRHLQSTRVSTVELASRSCHNINTPADLESQ